LKSVHKDLFLDKLPEELVTITTLLEEGGYSTWLVGGAVRDLLLEGHFRGGDEDRDFDFALLGHVRLHDSRLRAPYSRFQCG